MLVIADRVKETTTTTGAGPLALGGAMTGFRAFSAVCSISDTVFYAIQLVDANGAPANEWEVGLGTYSSANTLTRTTPQASSNGGAAVNFSVGTKQVWLDLTATQLAGLATSASLSAYATTSYVDAGDAALSAAISAKPSTAYVDAADALRAPLASPALTGTPTAPTAAADTNSTQLATTAYVIGQGYAKLASPTFTGTVTTDALTAAGLFTQATEDNITAFSGGGQANAAALSATKNTHRVATVGAAGDSTKLPAALVGQWHAVANGSAGANNTLAVFPQTGETIAGLAANASVNIKAGASMIFFCATAGAWRPLGFGEMAYDYTNNAFVFRDNSVSIGISSGSRPNFIYAASAIVAANASAYFMINTDAIIFRPAANAFQFGGAASNVAGAATTRTEVNKTVGLIADATPTAVLTITIPNAAHSGSVKIRVTGSLGAGGAIGANEATAANEYVITLTRTAGVNAAAAISAASGGAAAAVAGAATVTCTAALSAVSGAVGASNTFTVNVTITKSGGASANHTCLVWAQLMNANATGITVA